MRKIDEEFPEIPVNTIHGIIWNLETRVPNGVYKPARGLFRHVVFREKEITGISTRKFMLHHSFEPDLNSSISQP